MRPKVIGAYGANVCTELRNNSVAATVIELYPEECSPLDLLTVRELEILSLVSEEYSSKEIAAELYISLHTVLSHRKNIIKKLGVKSVVGMVKMWWGRETKQMEEI